MTVFTLTVNLWFTQGRCHTSKKLNGFIKVYVYFLHCFVQRHVSTLVMSHLQVNYFS